MIRLLGVEKWLRTGLGPKGYAISPPNAAAHPNEADRQSAFVAMLTKIMLPKLLTVTLTHGERVIQDAARELDKHVNAAAFDEAVSNVGVLLVHGPMLHLTHKVGAYIVAPKQELTCSECDEKLHVLTGVMFTHSHTECTACHSKRCLSCTAHYTKTINICAGELQKKGTSGPTSVGKACRKCGAEPAKMTLCYVMDEDGEHTCKVRLGERSRKKSPQRAKVELRSGNENLYASQTPSPWPRRP